MSHSGPCIEFSIENIIIGAGPAGIQMAYFFERDDHPRPYLVLEASSHSGSFFKYYPRNRRLISVNKVNCGAQHRQKNIENILRYDWNSLLTYPKDNGKILFRDFDNQYYPSADALWDYLNAFTELFHLNIWYESKVKRLEKKSDDETFTVHFNRNGISFKIHCKKCFVATGQKCNPFPSQILQTDMINNRKNHNIELYTYENVPIQNLDLFRGKKVLIIGGGNAGFEIANVLNDVCHLLQIVTAEKFAWNNHYPGYLRSVNMKILDSYYLKLQCNLDWETHKNLRDGQKLEHYIQSILNVKNHPYEIVIFCLGFSPAISFLDSASLSIDMSERTNFPEVSPFFEASCKNLYFIGSLSQDMDWKKGTSAFIHGFRYNCRLTYQYVTDQFSKTSYTRTKDVHTKLLTQLNRSSTLLHRFDYFADYVLIYNNSKFIYIEGLPLSIDDSQTLDNIAVDTNWKYVLKVYLGYSKKNQFFKTFRQPQTGNALHKDESVLIHPILMVFERHIQTKALEKIYEYHLPEEAFNQYIHTHWHCCFIMDILYYLKNGSVTKEALACIDKEIRFLYLYNYPNHHGDEPIFLDA